MNEPTKYEAAVAQMLEENKNLLDQTDDSKKTCEHTQPCPCAWCETERQNAEWQAEMKAHKIEQMHDFLGERNQEEEEE